MIPRGKELVRHPLHDGSPRRAARDVTYVATDHAPQYTIDRTALGEFALHWTADWLAGLFCITDFPAEWVAYIQESIRGGWCEDVYSGGGAGAFSSVVWDVSLWEFTPYGLVAPSGPVFSDVPLPVAAARADGS